MISTRTPALICRVFAAVSGIAAIPNATLLDSGAAPPVPGAHDICQLNTLGNRIWAHAGAGGALVQASDIRGAWTPVTDAVPPYTKTPSESMMFYRLSLPQSP